MGKLTTPSILKKIKIPKILKESLLIIFSILLALVINEFRSNQKLEDSKNKAMESIRLEIENNIESLEHVIPYHIEVGNSIEGLIEKENIQDSLGDYTGFELFFQHSKNGFKEPRIQANAWAAAQMSGALALFDNDLIYELSIVYELQQEGVETGWKKTVEIFSETESFDPEKSYIMLCKYHRSMVNLAGMEKYLLKRKKEMLVYLDKKN